jgi:nitrite reductase/ring-hydroxylating ferredoxin subunit
MEYVEAGKVEAVPPGKGTVFTVADKELAIFNVDGTFYAMDNACPHEGLSLGTSRLDGKIVTCRGHGWRYDVTTGSTLHVPGYGVATYPVKVADGKIMVAVGFRRLNPGSL